MSAFPHEKSKNDRKYLITIKTEYKLLEKKYFNVNEKLKNWEIRTNLAKESGNTDLQLKAENQAEILRKDINYLRDQLINLKIELQKIVKEIHKSPQELSIDPKKLLSDLNNLIGVDPASNIENEIKTIKVDNELEELKKKMNL